MTRRISYRVISLLVLFCCCTWECAFQRTACCIRGFRAQGSTANDAVDLAGINHQSFT